MQDLTERAGLAVAIEDGRLQFNEPVTTPRLSVRIRSNLDLVWHQQPLDAADPELYSVYWGAVPCADETTFSGQDLDHTYVLIRPGTWEGEYYKTQGHYHPPMRANRLGHPELYHVLAGEGLFLLQRAAPPDWQVDDVMVLDVKPGSIVVVPPNYGHLTCNYGAGPLVFEAFLANGLQPVTTSYQARRGGAAYCLQVPEGPRVEPNPHYGQLPEIQRTSAWTWPLATAGAFYATVTRHLEQFTWLREPDSFNLKDVQNSLIGLASTGVVPA
jgi:glucose-6-phosphate isomerase, archaeal